MACQCRRNRGLISFFNWIEVCSGPFPDSDAAIEIALSLHPLRDVLDAIVVNACVTAPVWTRQWQFGDDKHGEHFTCPRLHARRGIVRSHGYGNANFVAALLASRL